MGLALKSSETLIGTGKGVVRAYTVERLSLSVRWDINRILDMKGTPQKPDPSKPGLNIPAKMRLELDVAIDMPITRPARKDEGPRAAYLTREDFRNFGFILGCDGCGRLSSGMASRPHASKCRKRMHEEMKKTAEGRRRSEEADRKIHEYLESKLVAEHGVKDGADRLGITGSRVEEGPEPTVETEPFVYDSPSTHPGNAGNAASAHPGAVGDWLSSSPPRASPSTQEARVTGSADPPTAREKDNKAPKRGTAELDEDKKEKRMWKQGGTKRVAEDEGGNAERSDRKSWKDYIEPASSSFAPDNKGTKRDTREEEEKKGEKTNKPGGTKRAADEEADDSERVDRRSWENYVEPASSNPAPDSQMTASSSSTQIVPVVDKRDLDVPAEESGTRRSSRRYRVSVLGLAVQIRSESLMHVITTRISRSWLTSTMRQSSQVDVSSMLGRNSPATKI